MPDPFRLPRIKNLDRIVDAQGRPTIQFIKFFNTDFAGAIERQEAAQAVTDEELQNAIDDIVILNATQDQILIDLGVQQAALQAQVDRLTAILAGTGETFTGLSVGGTNMKPLLDRSDGTRFDDVTAIPANAVTVSGTRPDLVMTAEGEDVAPHTSARIVMSAHTFQLGATSVSIDGGTVGGLLIAPTLRYYVYYDDPTFAGGAVTYVATQDIADLTAGVGRFVVGHAVTPDSAGAGGSATVATPSWNF